MIQLFNTRSSKKESFQPSDPKNVKLYTCGPTVYDYAHIGNLRTYVAEDLLKRALIFLGYKVDHVMNLTDVDDKTIKGAVSKNISLNEYTQTFKDAFFEDLKSLHILPAQNYPAATDHIPQMVEMIEELLKKEIAYKGSDGSIYFSIKKFPNYGCLSHLKLEDLKTGASNRLESDEYDKETACDFVLWKKYDSSRDGSVFWESPFGPGRPGWHLECSAMAVHYLGQTLDLHMGGVDNIFPHHENEIAQSEACTGHNFCPFWVHVEHLLVNQKKMSKSLGNFYTLRDLLEQSFSPAQIRYLLITSHYRTQLNFTLEGLKAAGNALERLQNFIERLIQYPASQHQNNPAINQRITQLQESFSKALSDDLNISQAMAEIFDFTREVNLMMDKESLSYTNAQEVLKGLEHLNQVLGFLSFKVEEESIPNEMQQALINRQKARAIKDWAEADRLRDHITSQGYMIIDTPGGPQLKKAD